MRLHSVSRWLACGLACFVLVGCTTTPPEAEVWPNKPGPKVLVSFPPVYSFVASVAGDDASVKVLLTGAGPHSNPDPTAQQLKLAKSANLFFINGLGLDDQLVEKIQSSGGKSEATVVELGEKLDPKTLKKEEGHGHHHHHDAKEGEIEADPHVWLSPSHVKKMVEVIRDELKKVDTAHAAGYDKRADEYLAVLTKLEADGKAMLKDKTEKKIIAFHDSLDYFADNFGLTIAGVVQLDPGQEPSKTHIKDLIALCKKEKVRVIAVEPQFKRDHAETLLKELKLDPVLKDAALVEIDTLETADSGEVTPDFYERKMRTNLQNLANVLK
jgi:ABC-type Zn uptake system ZnuABC Zn-binding protein ZnuA